MTIEAQVAALGCVFAFKPLSYEETLLPFTELDVTDQQSEGWRVPQPIRRAPCLRFFGVSASGQTAAVTVHGLRPHFYFAVGGKSVLNGERLDYPTQ